MLNPLSRHEPSCTNDLTTGGDGNDFEIPISSPDTSGYIGKKNFISVKSCQFFSSNLYIIYQIILIIAPRCFLE